MRIKLSPLSPFNSKEKQFVRNRQWLKNFRELLTRMDRNNIKYLCYPALDCAFIKQLLGMGLICDKTTVVAIEPNRNYHVKILEYFSRNFEKNNYEVIRGKYEDLILEESLRKWFLKNPIGFDILELDFPAALYSLNPDGRSKFLDAIFRTLSLQSIGDKKYYLIIAFKTNNKIPPNLQKIYGTPTRMLLQNILQKENEFLNNPILEEFINSDQNNDDFNYWCSIYAIPLGIMTHCGGLCNIKLHSIPFTHISRSVGARSRIVTYVFNCEPRYTSLHNGHSIRNEVKDNMYDAIKKIHNTIWVDRIEIFSCMNGRRKCPIRSRDSLSNNNYCYFKSLFEIDE